MALVSLPVLAYAIIERVYGSKDAASTPLEGYGIRQFFERGLNPKQPVLHSNMHQEHKKIYFQTRT
jgi:hypothetical protein